MSAANEVGVVASARDLADTAVVREEAVPRARSAGTYWGPGLLVGQGAVFAVLGALLTGVLVFSLVSSGWDVGNAVFVGVPALVCWWAALRPRVHVSDDVVTLHSYVRSLRIPQGQLDDALALVRPRSVRWFYGANLPEISVQGERPMLLPMFVLTARPWFDRLPRHFLASAEDLSSFESSTGRG